MQPDLLHQLAQAEHEAGPLKPIRGVFAVTKQHNEIRQEQWGPRGGPRSPGLMATRYQALRVRKAKCGQEVGQALGPDDKVIFFFFSLQKSCSVCCSPERGCIQVAEDSFRR